MKYAWEKATVLLNHLTKGPIINKVEHWNNIKKSEQIPDKIPTSYKEKFLTDKVKKTSVLSQSKQLRKCPIILKH